MLLAARSVCSIVSSAVIRPCAWLITCCSTSSDALDACFVRQSAIWHRATIHLRSDSLHIAVTWQWQARWQVACPLTMERILPFESRRTDCCSPSPTTLVALSEHTSLSSKPKSALVIWLHGAVNLWKSHKILRLDSKDCRHTIDLPDGNILFSFSMA